MIDDKQRRNELLLQLHLLPLNGTLSSPPSHALMSFSSPPGATSKPLMVGRLIVSRLLKNEHLLLHSPSPSGKGGRGVRVLQSSPERSCFSAACPSASAQWFTSLWGRISPETCLDLIMQSTLPRLPRYYHVTHYLGRSINRCARQHSAAFLKWEPGISATVNASPISPVPLSRQSANRPAAAHHRLNIRADDEAILARDEFRERAAKSARVQKNGIRYYEASHADVAIFNGMMQTTGAQCIRRSRTRLLRTRL